MSPETPKRPRGRPKGSKTRKPAFVDATTGKPVKVSKVTAGDILGELDEKAWWIWAMKEARKRKMVGTVLDGLKYLTDRRDGRPAQSMQVEAKAPVKIEFITSGNGNNNP